MNPPQFTYHQEETIKTIVREELKEAKLDTVSVKMDKVITMLDQTMGELKAIREEHALQAGKLSEHTDILEDYAERIEKIEKRQAFPTVSL